MLAFQPVSAQPWPQSIVELSPLAEAAEWSAADMDRLWHTHDLMSRLFAGRYRGSGRPFLNHLAGTAALALMHGGSPDEVIAGYAHAAYEQGEFGRLTPGATERNRADLRHVLGHDAEAMVLAYGPYRWEVMCARLMTQADPPPDAAEASVAFLRIANELDESFDRAVYDATWFKWCVAHLEEGAVIAGGLGRESLAAHIHDRIEEMRALGPGGAPGARAKGSHTIVNPASMKRPGIRVLRGLRWRLARLRG